MAEVPDDAEVDDDLDVEVRDDDSLEKLRADTEAELSRLLPRRDSTVRVGVLGAGSDDLESGQAYLGELAAGGFAVPTWPVEYGGMGLDKAAAAIVRSALSEFEAPDLYPFLVGVDLIGPTILAHAGDEQKKRWLAKIRSGEEIWCQMFSEPDAGSDLAGLKSRAVRDGDGWRISGSKVWTSRAHYSQWGLLVARHDPSLPKHAGITAFALDMSAPGVAVRPLLQMNRDAHFNEVFLDDAWIPDRDRIGAVGDGWRVAITCLSFERGALGGGLGTRVEQIKGLGDRIGSSVAPAGAASVLRDQWAARYADFAIAGWSASRARAAREAGRAPGPEDSLSKLGGTALIKKLSALGLAAEGPEATVFDGDPDEWQSMFLMSPSLSIRGGTDEIQHNILGERVLGLPAEPRVDKDKPFSETV
ncbi:MAG TPA: acyl-CoA dehydrogenase family protein [Acidimicrobiales bacterium]|nr:acyl-CoA dehydrogenase family protein [Acidimicrobiales bacterium]